MVERCADNGFDMLHDRVEVSPSAHFQMGGVHIDLECRSSLEGLFAAGEDAAGVHGANRLGGNGVADSIVFGAHAGDVMSQSLPPQVRVQVSDAEIREMCEQWSAPLRLTGGEHTNALRREIENLMWEKVGLVRNGADLTSALDELSVIGERAARQSANPQTAFNLEWNEALDVMNIATNAQLVARGALLREESRGSHFRRDFPKPNPQWLKRIRLVKKGDDIDVSYLPVKFTRMTPPELEPAEAVAASRT